MRQNDGRRPVSTSQLQKIRASMGYSIEEFAELLALKKPTYYGYETGMRRTPPCVLTEAREAQKRDKRFFKELPKRVDAELKGRPVPNAALPGEW